MPKVLVTAGNISEPTFYGVCYAVAEVLGGVEDAVHIFDSPRSAAQAETTHRASRIRDLLGPVDVSTSLVTDENLQVVIPDRLSRLLRQYKNEDLVIDLSNGQKLTTSVLYAVATISRLSKIYALEFTNRPTQETAIQKLSRPKEWDYVQIQPLKEILNITQSSYVELIYYRDRIDDITTAIQAKNPRFADAIKDRLDNSLIDYFALSAFNLESPERLERCVNGLGKVCEDIAIVWYGYCCQNGIILGPAMATDFNARVKQIIKRWGEYRAEASSGKLASTNEIVREAIIPTLGVDTQLETMRVYRNLASHSMRHYYYSKADARLALDLTLLILQRLSQSAIIDTPQEEEGAVSSA